MIEINYIHEPTDLQCGQAVLAMLTNVSVSEVCEELANQRETTLSEMREFLAGRGITLSSERRQAATKADLPEIALLSLETPRCWHWSLYAYGVFYDPEHGVLEDFPQSARKFYWQVIL